MGDTTTTVRKDNEADAVNVEMYVITWAEETTSYTTTTVRTDNEAAPVDVEEVIEITTKECV